MKRYLCAQACWCVGWALICYGPTALANGFRLPDQDAEATARGEAFVATADNPSAIYYNPAGISQLQGANVRAGVHAISLDQTFESPSGSSFSTKNEFQPVPQAYVTYGLESLPLTFGLGVYAPYGLGIEWPQDTGFRSLALQTELTYLTINPVVAWRILTNLSVAAGPTFNYSEVTIRRGLTPFPNNDLYDLQASGFAYGATAGVLWQPLPQLSLGASYRSETKVNYEGNSTVNFTVPPPGFPPSLKMDASVEIPTPQNVVGGISYRPTPNWNLEFDVDWTDWSRLKTIAVHQLIPDSLVLNWNSSFYYELGLTHYFSRGWHVSAGYIYNENSIPNQTYTPLVPDQDRQFVSVGAGYRGKHFQFDAAYQFGFSSTRTVVGSPVSAVGQTADGRYDYISNAITVSAGWHF